MRCEGVAMVVVVEEVLKEEMGKGEGEGGGS